MQRNFKVYMKNNFLVFLWKYYLPRQNTEYQLYSKKELNFKVCIIIFFRKNL